MGIARGVDNNGDNAYLCVVFGRNPPRSQSKKSTAKSFDYVDSFMVFNSLLHNPVKQQVQYTMYNSFLELYKSYSLIQISSPVSG